MLTMDDAEQRNVAQCKNSFRGEIFCILGGSIWISWNLMYSNAFAEVTALWILLFISIMIQELDFMNYFSWSSAIQQR